MSPKSIGIIGLVIFFSSFIFLAINGWMFSLLVLIGLGIVFYGGNKKGKEIKFINAKNKESIKKIIAKNNIEFDDIVFSLDNEMSLLFNDKQHRIYFIDQRKVKEYSYSDILESRIVENKESITVTSRGSQIGGALLGGIIAGGVGAIIGGLSGSKRNISKVESLELYIIVNDTSQPIQKISFFDKNNITSPKIKEYEKVKHKIEHWHHLISVLIKRADDHDKNAATN
jgi:hypothetical protein